MQERAQIGKHAADNGATKAATHFSKLLDSKIGESNISIVELTDKNFTSSAALHAVCVIRQYKLPKLIEDYVICRDGFPQK